MKSSKIIDAFPYANEELVLEVRFNELYESVDYFLIVESNRTQTGLVKPYYFEENKEKFRKFSDKIIYLKLDDSNIGKIKEADWSQENSTRKAISKIGLQEISKITELYEDDYLIISDCDEIPRAETINKLKAADAEIISLNHYFNSYYFNLYSNFRAPWGWYGSILTKLKYLNINDIQYLRNIKDKLPHTGDFGEGWHFSNMLINGFESLYSKWLNNIEPHDKSCLSNKALLNEQFNQCVHNESHLFFCDKPLQRNIYLEKLPLENLPKFIKDNEHEYAKYIK